MNYEILYKFVINNKYITAAYSLDYILTFGLNKDQIIREYLDENMCIECDRGGCGELICELNEYEITDTVSCTGYTDSSGKFIFDGDIVEFSYFMHYPITGKTVIYNNNGGKMLLEDIRGMGNHSIRILGNIRVTPNLMTEE